MSLLMQALKKAERAKQSHHGEDDVAKPSEAFDQVLELAPQEGIEPAFLDTPMRTEPALDPALEPSEGSAPLTLSPLDLAAPAHENRLDLPPIGAASSEVFSTGVPPTHVHQIQVPPADLPPAEAPPEPPVAAPPKRARNTLPPPPAAPRVRPKRRALPVLSAGAIRSAALSAGVLIVASVFGYIYWHEMYGAGSSRHLPPVPMPGQNLPPATDPSPAASTLIGPPPIDPAAPATAAIAPPAGEPAAVLPAPAPAEAPIQVAPPQAAPPAQPTGPLSSREQMPPEAYMRAEPAPPPAAAKSAPASSGLDDIRVARASNPEQIHPGIASGYAAYQRGDVAAARQSYGDVLRQDPANRDALLGMAAIAARAGQHEQAGALYTRLLEIDAGDTDALAGMASIGADGTQSETRLRQAVERNPDSGPALFALGNLYARQGRWQEAQQHYFRAYTSAPANADYAFNLAVGLDRLGQRRLAATYYEKALALAGSNSGTAFDRATANARLRELGTP